MKDHDDGVAGMLQEPITDTKTSMSQHTQTKQAKTCIHNAAPRQKKSKRRTKRLNHDKR